METTMKLKDARPTKAVCLAIQLNFNAKWKMRHISLLCVSMSFEADLTANRIRTDFIELNEIH